MNTLFAALAIAASVAVVPVANAQETTTVHYIGAGASATWQGFGVSAYNDLAGSTTAASAPVSAMRARYRLRQAVQPLPETPALPATGPSRRANLMLTCTTTVVPLSRWSMEVCG